MAIATLDDLIGAAKQQLTIYRNQARTTVAAQYFSIFDLAGQPGAGTLAGTRAGVMPTGATAGCPKINTFAGGAVGYLLSAVFFATVACRAFLADMIWKGGGYLYNDTVSVGITTTSWSARVPGGTDYTDVELWLEVTTAFATGTNWNLQITYTNESGTGSRVATLPKALAAASLTEGKMLRIPLQAGDAGVQSIQSVITTNGATEMTAGTFNILALRRYANWRVGANGTYIAGMSELGLPFVPQDAAFVLGVAADSTAMPIVEAFLTIASK